MYGEVNQKFEMLKRVLIQPLQDRQKQSLYMYSIIYATVTFPHDIYIPFSLVYSTE